MIPVALFSFGAWGFDWVRADAGNCSSVSGFLGCAQASTDMKIGMAAFADMVNLGRSRYGLHQFLAAIDVAFKTHTPIIAVGFVE
jgi:hypothetical protein